LLKIAPIALTTAAACVGIAAATGLGAAAPPALNMKVRQVIYLKSGNFHCQALTRTEIACGANSIPGSVQVYFTPHEVAVLKFTKTGKNAKIIYATKR
jgi:hypothetical protein